MTDRDKRHYQDEPIIATDRYEALGITPPPQACPGPCEATGWVPVYLSVGNTRRSDDKCNLTDETDPELIRRWKMADAAEPTLDGWHFVRCPTCGGSGGV